VDAPNCYYLSSYKGAAVGYIAGYAVRMVKRSVTCESCIDALVEKDPNNTKFNSLVRQKNHGGLPKHRAMCGNNSSFNRGKLTHIIKDCLSNFISGLGRSCQEKMHSHLSMITCLTTLLTTTISSG
jgi:hypothetical protein